VTKEEVYDEQINPHMTEIIRICKENRIAFLADFRLDEDLACTSGIVEEDCHPSDHQLEAWEILKPRKAWACSQMTETKPDGTTKITINRIS
jgi:hypothetical protein